MQRFPLKTIRTRQKKFQGHVMRKQSFEKMNLFRKSAGQRGRDVKSMSQLQCPSNKLLQMTQDRHKCECMLCNRQRLEQARQL